MNNVNEEIEQELGVMQLSDSFFPTGIFSTSNGLESLCSEEKIKDADGLTEIIKVCIVQQMGPADCVALANAFDGAGADSLDKVIKSDQLIFAMKPVKESRDASVRSGVQLVRCVSGFVKDDMLNGYQNEILKDGAHGVFPVAFAVCCNALKITKEKSMTMLLYGFTVSMVGAALRLGLIQHFEGQQVVHAMKPVISQTVTEYADRPLSEMWQFAPQMDITQMSHEKKDSKMFIT